MMIFFIINSRVAGTGGIKDSPELSVALRGAGALSVNGMVNDGSRTPCPGTLPGTCTDDLCDRTKGAPALNAHDGKP